MLSGANLTANGTFYMAYGHRATPASGAPVTHAYLTISNATMTANGWNGLYFNHGQYWPSGTSTSTEVDVVLLQDGAVLTCSRLDKNAANGNYPRSSRIDFDGGKIVFARTSSGINQSIRLQYNARNSNLGFKSLNGQPIHLVMGNNSRYQDWFEMASKGTRAYFEGAGGLILEGNPSDNKTPGWLIPENNVDDNYPSIKLKASLGFLRLVGMPLVNRLGINYFADQGDTKPQALITDSGTYFDMCGHDAEFKSVHGCIKNTDGNSCVLTIGGDNSDSVIDYELPAGVSVVKKGSGRLTTLAVNAPSITVQGGTLDLKGRREMGYRFYKFKVEEYGYDNGSNVQMKFHELSFLFAGEDVTRPYAALHHDKLGSSYVEDPETLVDGDLSTIYYDLRIQKNYGDSDRDRVQLTVEYPECHPVDAYRWAPHKGSDGYKTSPTSWKFYGGMSKTDMTLLDQVDNFETTDALVEDGWVATNFVCTYANPATTIDSLTLASGTALNVDGADVTATAVTASSAIPLTLAHGATLTLPTATEIASLNVDVDAGGGTLTNFRPAANGAIYLTGNVGRLSNFVVPVSVGMLLGDNLSSWAVYVDGQLQSHIGLFVNDDHFLQTESHIPTILVVR